MEEQISLSVQIADRSYKLKTSKTEEEIFNKAIKLIDERLKIYAQSFATQDKQDLLAMIALEFSIMNQKNMIAHNNEIKTITEDLSALDELLTDYQPNLHKVH